LTSVRHRCRRQRHRGDRAKEAEAGAEGLSNGDRHGRGDRDAATRRTSASGVSGGNVGGTCEVTSNTPSWTELAREAAHVSSYLFAYYTYLLLNGPVRFL